MNPFEQIANINDRRRAFLEEMCSHYNFQNRAVDYVKDVCHYEPSATSRGCVIGAWCPEIAGMSGTVVSAPIWNLLPKWMKEMSKDFLRDCQIMHDCAHFWINTGLSYTGRMHKQHLLIAHCGSLTATY
jgi:hypothetical protein